MSSKKTTKEKRKKKKRKAKIQKSQPLVISFHVGLDSHPFDLIVVAAEMMIKIVIHISE